MSLLESFRNHVAFPAAKNRRFTQLPSQIAGAALIIGGLLSAAWALGLVWLAGRAAGVW